MKTKKRTVRLSVDWTEDSWVPQFSVLTWVMPVLRPETLPLVEPPHRRAYTLPMMQPRLAASRRWRAFTLIEMLVVIGIIAILAGILLPTIAVVKQRAKVQIAKAEMVNLIAAINAYESDYSRPPASKEVETALAAATSPTHHDYTYGGGEVDNPHTTIQFTNNVVMNIIMDRDAPPNKDHARNPRRIVTFQAKPSSGDGFPGIDNDGILRDPWGRPYIITIDMNDDNKAVDAFYGTNNVPVVIWSLGRDGRVDTGEAFNDGVNRDNVLSWK